MRFDPASLMLTIAFDGVYKKMPYGIHLLETWVKDIGVIEYADIPESERLADTERTDGTHYQLPTGKLIWVKFWSVTALGGEEWITYRRFTQENYDILKQAPGHEVKVIIKKT